MKALAVVALSFLAASPALAAVSGYYDSSEQITTILGDPRVADALRQAPIGQIANTGTRKNGAKEWQIRVQECDLTVTLIPVPPPGPGKTTYRVDTVEECR